ncbi:LytTR family DNA-binding domain-containing protein [Comamonas sp. NLF-1-9]|uniref:LytR/AlgR family response regulator transcription factor n=1 Tax=Comamonas sp. NLF-1-9 TaxID=2853163 RepID=UPI001C46BEC1|nr:LytTR family DNA-binding domain-containing protein [Comamonas sp. NLF-1-9]QXL84654.1 LytTR family DNA-binding domain-containing protein [Comamonas sp. NLF-1-9]
MNQPAVRALIAEDEPLLAQALQQALARAWPQLTVVATVGDGLSAVREALALRPELLFFDIRMPGQSGLEAAAELFDAWPAAQRLPLLVFTTAYDQYAVQAFEAQASDYLLKPIQDERLHKTVHKLQQALGAPASEEATLRQLRALLAQPPTSGGQAGAAPARALKVLQAGSGQSVQLVPLAQVLYFEAADKYVRVLTAEREHLLRTPLKEIAAQLDPDEFWQIHRGTLVRVEAIRAARRDEAGRITLELHQRPERLAVSRVYAPLFKAM